MRVIAGQFRSRRLKTPPGLDVRPTPDRLREALFNILAPRLTDCIFVDAYAGCGAVGIEALSRGASQCCFIERSRRAIQVLRDNLASLGITDRARVIHGNAATYLGSLRADIYFLDPPYERTEEYDKSLGVLGDHGPAVVILQHSSHFALPEQYRRLRRYRQLRQGDNTLSFFETIE